MKVTFLGTGTSQGIPVINSNHPVCLSSDKRDKRLRVSIMIQWDDYTYIVDCGPDFRYQMLRANVTKIDGILFTHEHSDHVAGLDDIRPFYFQIGAVPVYASQRVLDNLKMRFDYILNDENKYPGSPSVIQNIVTLESFQLKNKQVIPIEVLHGELPVLGFRIDNFAYLTDVKTISNTEKSKLQGLDVLVISALRIEEHRSHLNLEEALTIIEELNPKQAYLTHISHKLGFHAEVEKKLPKNVYLAFDELSIQL